MGIDHGGSDIIVAKKSLDGPDIVISLEKMGGKAVAESMGSDSFGEFGPSDGFVKWGGGGGRTTGTVRK